MVDVLVVPDLVEGGVVGVADGLVPAGLVSVGCFWLLRVVVVAVENVWVLVVETIVPTHRNP